MPDLVNEPMSASKGKKNTVHELLSLSTVHGISKIVNYESLELKIFWVTLLCSSIVGLCCLISLTIKR